MALNPQSAVEILQGLDFHLYHAKSTCESLLVHSLSVFSLVHAVLPFTQVYSDADKEVMRWAALLHDYGKTPLNWQKAKKGPHRVSLGDTTYDELRSALGAGIASHSVGVLHDGDIDDILFIIEFHHASGRGASTPIRSRMKDLVSECDMAVSQDRISDELIRALNTVVDTLRYRLFTIELIDHPISPLVIGAFDYVLAESGSIQPLLYSATSTLYIAPVAAQLPPVEEVNRFLKVQFSDSGGVVRYDGSNGRIYTDARRFLGLASDPEAFVRQATAYANDYCARQKKSAERDPERWSGDKEEEYLYGRVCGITYNTLLDLCGVPNREMRPACLAAGGKHGKVTVEDMRLLGLRQGATTYEQTLRAILNRLMPWIQRKLGAFPGESPEADQRSETFDYDVRDLLVGDTDVYPAEKPLDPRKEAADDYAAYMQKDPLSVCPACSQFPQGNLTAAAFPQPSPLGGTVEVFYTTHMRLIKKEGPAGKGVSLCSWCSKWWDRIATDPDGKRQLYRLCVIPHHLFGRLEWREILGCQAGGILVELGAPGTISASGVYPHMAVMALRGRDREALLHELVADPERGNDQVVERLYRYGLKGAVIVTNPVSSRHLLTCGSIAIDAAQWPVFRTALRLLDKRRTYARAITALQQSPYAFGTFLADKSIRVTKDTEKEVRRMVTELAERTGLAFLKDIWIAGQDRVDSAGKVIRGMNETLRRLKDGESDASLIDAMVAKGLHLALSTRKGLPLRDEDQEKAALRLAAEKLLRYRNQTYRRTEVVRAMIYTLAYFSRPGENTASLDASTPASEAMRRD